MHCKPVRRGRGNDSGLAIRYGPLSHFPNYTQSALGQIINLFEVSLGKMELITALKDYCENHLNSFSE